MQFVLFALLVVLLLVLLYFAVVHPLWCIVDCAFSKTKSGSEKLVWIVATFLTGCLAATAYTIIGTKSALLRYVTKGVGAIGLLCFLAVLGVSYTRGDMGNLLDRIKDDAALASVTELTEGGASEVAIDELNLQMEDLETLRSSLEILDRDSLEKGVQSLLSKVQAADEPRVDPDVLSSGVQNHQARDTDEPNGEALVASGLAEEVVKELGIGDLVADLAGNLRAALVGQEGEAAADLLGITSGGQERLILKRRQPETQPQTIPTVAAGPTKQENGDDEPYVERRRSAAADLETPPKTRVFNRYRNSSEPLKIQPTTVTVRNRYTQQ